MSERLPAHLEIAGLRRLAEAQGGTAMVLSRGERDAGTILVSVQRRGEEARLFERMPMRDGSRAYTQTRVREAQDSGEFTAYLDRRSAQDPDCWIIEVDIDDPERFVASLPG